MKTLTALTLLTLATAGCKVAATAEDYRWTVSAPSQVVDAPRSKLRFVVHAQAADGRPAAEVPYMWVVDWVGVHGIRHQGWSGREEHLQVKGEPGTAVLRILVFNHAHDIVEVAQASFQVTAGEPNAK